MAGQRPGDYLYIAGTIAFMVGSQLLLKWRANLAGAMPAGSWPKIVFLLRIVAQPWVIGAFAAAFLAALCWTAAMTRFDISFAYPFMSLAFALVILASGLLFHEPLGWEKIGGLLMICGGLYLISQGH